MNVSTAYGSTGALTGSVRKTLTNTFITISGMWGITAVSSFLALGWNLGLGGSLALFGASLLCVLGVLAFRNSGFGLLLLALFSGLEGASLGPLLNHYLQMRGGSSLVLTAAGLTGLATFSCAAYCMMSRRSFSRLGGFLFAGLIVLVVASLVSLFVHSTMLHLAISVVACLLFTAYMLYDISAVVTGEETNYVVAALSVYLDMLNLFLHVLRILSIFSSSDD